MKLCLNCGKNPVDSEIGEGSIWCRDCNEQWVADAMAAYPLTDAEREAIDNISEEVD